MSEQIHQGDLSDPGAHNIPRRLFQGDLSSDLSVDISSATNLFTEGGQHVSLCDLHMNSCKHTNACVYA